MMKLKELLDSIDILQSINDTNITISGISYHSQKVSDGDVFVCIRGLKVDGHKFLQSAVNNGAKAAIVEEFNESIDIPQYLVKNSRIAMAQLSAFFYDHPSRKMKMIGITASNGKTTTSYMTNALLENHGFKTGLIGTVHIKMDEEKIPSELTTPESLDLQYYLNEMTKRNISHTTMEVSSIAQEMHRNAAVDYDIVTFNNLSREHIDSHGSFEKYFEAKSRLIKNADKNSFAILNLDCPYSSSLVDKTEATPITFSVEDEKGDFYCKDLDLSTGRAKFTVVISRNIKLDGQNEISPTKFHIEMAVPGLHSVYNAMVSIIIALLNRVSVPVIQQTMKSFEGVERRFEFIYEDKIKILDDHFANPGNIDVTLQTLHFMDYNKLHLVYAIRGDRGPTVNRENAEAIAKWASKLGIKEIVATKSVSHVTAKDKVTNEEAKVFLEVMAEAGIEIILYDELPGAIRKSLAEAVTGDLVLLAGCQGMDHGAEIALQILHGSKPAFAYPKR